MNILTFPAKTLFATLAMLPLLSGSAGAQETPVPTLDPEIPWFKVEVIVFRDLRQIPDDEIFTPPPSEIIPGPADDDQDGVIDARALGQAGSSADEFESDNLAGTFQDETAVPAFGDTLPYPDSDQATEADQAQSDYDSIVPGSYFRLIAMENLVPDEQSADGVPAPARADPRQTPKAGMSREEVADFALMNELELTKESKRLRNSRNYELLAHMAWIQPGYARDDAIAFPLAELAGPASGLHGDLTLHLSRYLHMQFDLAIADAPTTPGEKNTAPLEALVGFPGSWGNSDTGELAPEYRITEKRRMRSGELHYIDHPRFGVLARISKVKPELVQQEMESSMELANPSTL